MTTAQFQAAFDIAKSDRDLTAVDDSVMYGYGLPDFKPVVATIEAVARTIRWQCQYLTGGWDSEALNECRNLFRHRVTIL